jgi:DNA-binding response OmpR family regulator
MATILIVDDDADARRTICYVLAASGYDVLVTPGGKHALDLCRTTAIDLVVTDIFMPDKNGIDLMVELRQIRPATKIVAVSGGGRAGNKDLLSAAELLGAIETIQKPFDPDEFLERVAACLQR